MNFSLPKGGKRARFLQKIIRLAMKISLVYISVIITSLQLFAHTGSGQNLDTIYVNVGSDNGSLKEFLFKIQSESGLTFNFYPDQVNPYKVNIPSATRSVRTALDLALMQTPLVYIQISPTILVIKEKPKESTNVKDIQSSNVDDLVQSFKATGKVTDVTSNTPLPGVNILIKGTTSGTTTDSEGKFSIDVNDNDVIIFSFIGYKTQEVQVTGGRNVFDIALEDDIKTLQEVTVNAGYWQVKTKEQTGTISRITSKEIGNQPVSNPLASLIGRMPGVSVQQTSGIPGGGFNIQIRGRNSLREDGNNPLFIIDGVPVASTGLSNGSVSSTIYGVGGASPFNAINPGDIESIEVLKDADATAIYGSRGSNGVILITTKKGKVSRTTLDINVNQGVGKANRKMDLLNTKQYLNMRLEAIENDGWTPYLTPKFSNFFPDILLWDTTRYTDWQKELFGGTANTTNAQATFSSGNSNTQFLFSGNYYKETTVFPGDFDYQKASTHFNLSHASDDKKFRFSLSISYVADKNNLPKYDITPIALRLAPNAPALYNESGDLNWQPGYANPLASYIVPEYEGKTKNLIANSVFDYSITPELHLRTSVGYTNMDLKEFSTNPISSNNPASGITTGYAVYGVNDINTWIIEPQVEYQKSIGRGKLTSLLGATFQQNLQEGQSIYATGFRSDQLLENIKFATGVSVDNFTFSKYRYNAIFGRINYDWEGKYIINLTGRRDGSSRFGPDKQFANFGAVGIAWIFSNESFIADNQSFLSFGKIRASIGSTGSDQIGDYEFMDTYSATTHPYNGVAGLIPTRLYNPDYRWEKNTKLEAAIELGFFDDKIFLSVSSYRNRSSNQLIGYSLPVVTGFSSVQYNLPATVQNAGVEIDLSAAIVQTNNLVWKSSINFTVPQSKLVKFPSIEDYAFYKDRWEVGRSLSIFKGLRSTGVDPETGVYTFEDVNKNGSIAYPEDIAILNSGLKSYGGFSNSLAYKGFQFDFSFQFVKQTSNNYLSFFRMPGLARENQPVEVMNRWRNAGDVATIQKFSQTSGAAQDAFTKAFAFGDNVLSDASFIRLKNVSLSWSIPEKWSSKYKSKKSRIYLQGQNLFTITDYRGLDPEARNASLPPLRMIVAGLQITF